MAQLLGNVAVGTIVKLKENGSPVEFYVAKHDYESGLNGAGRTLLVRKNVSENRAWQNSDNVSWGSSDLRKWLNDTYLNKLDAKIKTAIGYTYYYYTNRFGDEVETRFDSVFTLSLAELGRSNTWANSEGSTLPIAETLRQPSQWTRTPYQNGPQYAWRVMNGTVDYEYATRRNGARPVFTLPASMLVLDDGTIPTAPPAPSTISVPGIGMQGQQITVNWSAVDGADSYILERKANTDSDWTQVYSGANLTYTETVGTWTSVQYRVKAGVSGVYGEYATSASVPVVSASSLVISGSDGDLGTLTGPVTYSVSSDTGNAISVTETVNGVALRTYTATSGQKQSIAIPDLPTGSGSIVITASVQASSGAVNQTRNWTYTKTAPTFQSGPFDISTLSKGGKTQFPLTLAECVKMPLGLSMAGLLNGNITDLSGSPVGVQIKTGSYVGTGKSGASNKVVLRLPFPAKALFVSMVPVISGSGDYDYYEIMFLKGNQTKEYFSSSKYFAMDAGSARGYLIYVTFDDTQNIVKWYSPNGAAQQLNMSGFVYNYLALG